MQPTKLLSFNVASAAKKKEESLFVLDRKGHAEQHLSTNGWGQILKTLHRDKVGENLLPEPIPSS